MAQDDTLRPERFVHSRTGTRRWYYERPTPRDLRDDPRSEFHGRQWADRSSLRTVDLASANAEARRRSVRWDEVFAAERQRLNPQRLERFPDDLIPVLEARIRAAVLGHDDSVRFDPRRLVAFLEAWDFLSPPVARTADGRPRLRYFDTVSGQPEPVVIPPEQRDWLRIEPGAAGLSEPQLTRLGQVNRDFAHVLGRVLARGDLRLAVPFADCETRAAGFAVDWSRPENREALVAVLRAAATAWSDRVSRDGGTPLATPAAQALPNPLQAPKPARGTRIADVLSIWAQAADRPPRTIAKYRRAADLFRDLMGDPVLERFTDGDGATFADRLQEWAVQEEKTKTTATDMLGCVKTLLTMAQRRDLMPACKREPLRGLTIRKGGAKGRPRPEWTDDALRLLFQSPVFTGYEVGRSGGWDANYWVPLILAHSGARLGEIAQLAVSDILELPGGLALHIHADADRGTSVKGGEDWSSARMVPVHEVVMALGFGDYWRHIAASGSEHLFPALWERRKAGERHEPGNAVTKWFDRYCQKYDIPEGMRSHSFRHTVGTRLTLLDVDPTKRRAILGHGGVDVHEQHYTLPHLKANADALRPHLNRLRYEGINLRRVYTAPAYPRLAELARKAA